MSAFLCVRASLALTNHLYLPRAATSVCVALWYCVEFTQRLSCSKSNSLSPLFSYRHFHLCMSSDSCLCGFLPGSPPPLLLLLLPVSQKRSWIWTRATGRTFTSSRGLWNCSSVSFPSPWCPSASSQTLWRQSVSSQLHLQSNRSFFFLMLLKL